MTNERMQLKDSVVLLNCLQRWKVLAPQIVSVVIAASLHLFSGRCVAFGQVLAQQNENVSTGAFTFTAFLSAFFSGIATDALGRLATIKLAAVPGVFGLVTIALADNALIVTIGRALTALSFTFASTASIVYISEVSRKESRGACLTLAPLFVSIGILTVHVEAWFMTWRAISCVSLIYLLSPVIALRLLHESPTWLVSKKRLEEARRSSKWFDKFLLVDEHKTDILVEFEIAALEEECAAASMSATSKVFFKPLVIVTGVSLFQQLSGTVIAVANGTWVLDKITAEAEPYRVALYIVLLKIFTYASSVYLMTKIGRRSLLLDSTAATMLLMFITGSYTQWLYQDALLHHWIFFALVLMHYAVNLLGCLSIFAMTAEVFPLNFKGVGYGMASVGISAASFAVYEFYASLNFLNGASYHVEYLCVLFSMINLVLVYVFLPETHCSKVSDAVQYFSNHSVYFTASNKRGVCIVPLINER